MRKRFHCLLHSFILISHWLSIYMKMIFHHSNSVGLGPITDVVSIVMWIIQFPCPIYFSSLSRFFSCFSSLVFMQRTPQSLRIHRNKHRRESCANSSLVKQMLWSAREHETAVIDFSNESDRQLAVLVADCNSSEYRHSSVRRVLPERFDCVGIIRWKDELAADAVVDSLVDETADDVAAADIDGCTDRICVKGTIRDEMNFN